MSFARRLQPAIGILKYAGKAQTRHPGGKTVKVKITAKPRKKRYYGHDVEKAVLAVREFFRFVCGKRLVKMIRENTDVLLAFAAPALPTVAKAKTAGISRPAIGRFLISARQRNKARSACAAKPGTLLKQQIPVRTFRHRDGKKPGFTEADTVSHDGGFACGEYAFTLRLTYVAICRVLFRALRNKTRKWTLEAAGDIQANFPLPGKGIGTDNGSEFINRHLKDWCGEHQINFTRGRQYHKMTTPASGRKTAILCVKQSVTAVSRGIPRPKRPPPSTA